MTAQLSEPMQFIAVGVFDCENSGPYIDKIPTGFLTWTPSIKAYEAVGNAPPVSWDATSESSLRIVGKVLTKDDYFKKLSVLWSQESGKSGGTIDLRKDNVAYIKSLGMCCFLDWPNPKI